MPGGNKRGGGLKTKKGYKNKKAGTNGPAKRKSKPGSVMPPKRKKVRSVGLK